MSDGRITIDIDLASIPIEQAALAAARKVIVEFFHEPYYDDREGGPGYAVVARQVRECVEGLDVRDLVRAEVNARVDALVRDVTERALRVRIRKQIKEMREAGTLFDADEEESDGE